MRRSPVVASIVQNPKLDFVIDDGRRYLKRTSRRFDVIIQNTIVYWRAHATSLLSRENLELARSRLRDGGIVYFNTTRSIAAQRTAAAVFPHLIRYQNMVIAGDSRITIDPRRWAEQIERWQIDGVPVVRRKADLPQIVRAPFAKEWRGAPTWETGPMIRQRTRGVPVITDDNMLTEWSVSDTYP